MNLRQAAEYANGELIEVTSIRQSLVDTNLVHPVLTLLGTRVRRLGETNLPPPLRLKPGELTNGLLNYRRVAVVGRVTSHEKMYFSDRYIDILLAEGADGVPFRVEVLSRSNARERMPVGTEAEFVALQESEAKFRALYEISSAVLAVENMDSLYVRVHEAVRSRDESRR